MSQIIILIMLTMHCLTVYCLRSPWNLLGVKSCDTLITFLLDDLYVVTYDFEQVFFVCFVYTPWLWYLLDLCRLRLDISHYFINVMFGDFEHVLSN